MPKLFLLLLLSFLCLAEKDSEKPRFKEFWAKPFAPISIRTIYCKKINNVETKTSRILRRMVSKAVRFFRNTLSVRANDRLEMTKVSREECRMLNGTYRHTDFLLAVHYGSHLCGENTLAHALHCARDITGRPTAGFLRVCSSKFEKAIKYNGRREWAGWESTIKHEILHALGFARSLFGDYRMEDGARYSERGQGPVKKVKLKWRAAKGYVDHEVEIVITPRVVKEVREHFGCQEMEGAELENQGDVGSAGTHWEKRIFEDESMTAVRTHSHDVTRLTLALLEDSNWYRANYSMAGRWLWGKGLGCIFSTRSCLEWMLVHKNDPYPFCSIKTDFRCSPDRKMKVFCKAYDEPKFGRKEYKEDYEYRDQSIPGAPDGVGATSYADFCPYYVPYSVSNTTNSDCYLPSNNEDQKRIYALEVFSSSAKCLEIEDGITTIELGGKQKKEGDRVGCFETKCEKDRLWVKARNSRWYPCYHEGQMIRVNKRIVGYGSSKFNIICPACEELCEQCAPEEEPEAEIGDPEWLLENSSSAAGVLWILLQSLIN